jgi:hypothetical protein
VAGGGFGGCRLGAVCGRRCIVSALSAAVGVDVAISGWCLRACGGVVCGLLAGA